MKLYMMDLGLISLVLWVFFLGSPVAVRSVSASLKDPFIGIAPEGQSIVSSKIFLFLLLLLLFIFNLVLFITTDEKYYKTSSDLIKCKDGSKKFSKAQLNDDFCDCPDGTDEPGSSLSSFIPSIFSFFLSFLLAFFTLSLSLINYYYYFFTKLV